MKANNNYITALTIAGSDSGAGAGIQADLKTFAALGCYGTSVITALTAQNTRGVHSVEEISATFVKAQIDAVLDDIGAEAVKTGMLRSTEVVWVVAESLKSHSVKNLVVDPVLVAKGGSRLLSEDGVNSLKKWLLPLARVVTPNIPEAEQLLNLKIDTAAAVQDAAKAISDFGVPVVVLKGGHMEGDVCNDCVYFSETNKLFWLEGRRLITTNTHGTGCTFSAAIAAGLACGLEMEAALFQAKEYLTKAMTYGAKFTLGKQPPSGFGPLGHFWNFWPTKKLL